MHGLPKHKDGRRRPTLAGPRICGERGWPAPGRTQSVSDASRTRSTAPSIRPAVEPERERLVDLKETFQTDLQTLRGAVDTEALTVTEVKVAPRKSDLEIESLLLV